MRRVGKERYWKCFVLFIHLKIGLQSASELICLSFGDCRWRPAFSELEDWALRYKLHDALISEADFEAMSVLVWFGAWQLLTASLETFPMVRPLPCPLLTKHSFET